jgi:hypothetical protein
MAVTRWVLKIMKILYATLLVIYYRNTNLKALSDRESVLQEHAR